jgi:hypothetical protein
MAALSSDYFSNPLRQFTFNIRKFFLAGTVIGFDSRREPLAGVLISEFSLVFPSVGLLVFSGLKDWCAAN